MEMRKPSSSCKWKRVKYCDDANKGFLEMWKVPEWKGTRSFPVMTRECKQLHPDGTRRLTPFRCSTGRHSLQQEQVQKKNNKKQTGLALRSAKPCVKQECQPGLQQASEMPMAHLEMGVLEALEPAVTAKGRHWGKFPLLRGQKDSKGGGFH